MTYLGCSTVFHGEKLLLPILAGSDVLPRPLRPLLNSRYLDSVSFVLIIPRLSCAVSTKALEGAKSLGGFLYSAVNKAGKTVVEAGVKIKKTVEENVSSSFYTLSHYSLI